MLEKEAAKAKKFGKGMMAFLSFVIIVGAAFQIHRLWRASLTRAVNKYTASQETGDTSTLDHTTADAPPRGTLPDVGGPADSPANGDTAPGAGAEPNPADAPAE